VIVVAGKAKENKLRPKKDIHHLTYMEEIKHYDVFVEQELRDKPLQNVLKRYESCHDRQSSDGRNLCN
jgi:hypothetical protein